MSEPVPNWRKEQPNYLDVWSKTVDRLDSVRRDDIVIDWHGVNPDMWDGYSIRPPLSYIKEKSVLAAISTDETGQSMSLQLPEKPFQDDLDFRSQNLVISIRHLLNRIETDDTTFFTPFLPELNQFYGRSTCFETAIARAEVEGLGIIQPVTADDLTLHSIRVHELVSQLFRLFGMNLEPSLPGRIASRLIQQMDGIQGCRVFKIAGVRGLIEKYGPLATFTRSAAIQTIRQFDESSRKAQFEKYEQLHIAPREGAKLKPEHAFEYLVEHDVFRAGLDLKCPVCDLQFWLPLDDVKTKVACSYCGKNFNVSGQLKDRDWAYQRSGLFGREDHQEGSIPVALTLQQLATTISERRMVYVTAANISPVSAAIKPCETDFALLTQDRSGIIQVAIGECKSAGCKITEDDVTNLTQVANAFPHRIETFIIFSKTGTFSPDEITRCRKAQEKFRWRVILLSERELEPYFAYADTAKEYDIKGYPHSLADLAQNTHQVFFEPKRK
jgi:hypothetical protein